MILPVENRFLPSEPATAVPNFQPAESPAVAQAKTGWLISRESDEPARRFLQVGSGTWETARRATWFMTREDAAFYAAELSQMQSSDSKIVRMSERMGAFANE
ncbi:MAG: hypothetical protein AAFV88_13560 [Planctomycetota bacterium]